MASNKTAVKQIASSKCYGGYVRRYEHDSEVLQCPMKFHVFFPPAGDNGGKTPVLFFLAGLTCTDENFIHKAHAIKYAAEHRVALICPDTSPRGEGVPDDPENSWDHGLGAGFYVDATAEPFNKHYRMYSYIVDELPRVLRDNFGSDQLDMDRASIFGHSMGGMGALQIYLKNQHMFRSCSAFSPIAHPSSEECKWGMKNFNGYLGSDKSQWLQYDPTWLVENKKDLKHEEILIDQGSEDNFLPQNQLQPEALVAACKKVGYPLRYRLQEGYDHGYYFIQTFIRDHIEFHAKKLHSN